MTLAMIDPMRYDSYSVGTHGLTVCVFRRKPSGPFYVEIGKRRKSIRPRTLDAKSARRFAHKTFEALEEGQDAFAAGRATLDAIFRTYLKARSPRKSVPEQRADQTRALFWSRRLGVRCVPDDIRLHDWEAVIDERRQGRVCAHGLRIPHGKGRSRCRGPRPVSDRTIQAELQWLNLVFGWATKWRLPDGGYLMPENPVRGFPIPSPDARRGVASRDRYEAVMAVATKYGLLAEILPVAAGTGRRLSAVLSLRYADLRLHEGQYGAIRWRSAHDKQKRETVVPIGPEVGATLNRILDARPGIGEAWLFPSRKRGQRIGRSTADGWLRAAELEAGLPHLPGTLWHAYRRGWATARKHLPGADVAAAGGWKNARTLQTVYQQPDDATMERVVLEAVELRERR